MSINNPEDSVCDYLAELLYEQAPSPKKQAQPADRSPQFAEAELTPKDKEKLDRLLHSAPVQTTPEPLAAARQKLATAEKSRVAETPSPQKTSPEMSPEQPSDWLANGRPDWAQEQFDVLLFKVYGLTLAVPLVALGQIQPLDDQLTPLFGQAEWFMGILPTPMGKIKTVNTALFVMPERYNKAFLDSAKYVISLHGVDWGLAVDSVEQPQSLSPEDVKWRTSRTQRPWLAGTIKDHMCALIDIPAMARLLSAADRNSRSEQGG